MTQADRRSLSWRWQGRGSSTTLPTAPSTGYVLTWNAAGLPEWQAPSGGGGGGAPTNASYVVIALNGTLTAERALANGTATTVADGGAGGNVTINVQFGSTGSTACVGNDSRLSDARTPTAHAASHLPGGSDALTTAAPSSQSITASVGVGSAAAFARADHVHNFTMTSLRLAGRTTAGTGTVEEITVSAPLTFSALALGFDQTAALDNVARTTVRRNTGADVGSRRRLNFIEGTNVTLTVTDDGANEEVDITIAATGGGGGGLTHPQVLARGLGA